MPEGSPSTPFAGSAVKLLSEDSGHSPSQSSPPPTSLAPSSPPQDSPLHASPPTQSVGPAAEAEEPVWLTEAAKQVASTRSLDAREEEVECLAVHGTPVTCAEAEANEEEPEWLVEAAEAVSLLESSAAAFGVWAQVGSDAAAGVGGAAEALAAQAALSRATRCVQVGARTSCYEHEEETRAALADAEARLARMRILSHEATGGEPSWLGKATTAIIFAQRVSRRCRSVVQVTCAMQEALSTSYRLLSCAQEHPIQGLDTPTGHPVVTGRLVSAADAAEGSKPTQPAEENQSIPPEERCCDVTAGDSKSWSAKFVMGGVGVLAVTAVVILAVAAPVRRSAETAFVALTNAVTKPPFFTNAAIKIPLFHRLFDRRDTVCR